MSAVTTKNKLKVLLIGGDPVRNRTPLKKLEKFIDFKHITQEKQEVLPNQVKDAQAIVVVTKFVSNALWGSARKIKQNNKGEPIEIVQVLTVNHVVDGLKQIKRFAPYFEDEKSKKRVEPKPEEETAPVQDVVVESVTLEPVKQLTLGMSADELWDHYGEDLCKTVQATIKGGEKFKESALTDMLGSLVGVPADDVKSMLPQLALRGILVNTVADTWKVPALDEEYDYEPDQVEAPVEVPEIEPETASEPPKKHEHGFEMVQIISGLPEGPYDSMREIARVARRCPTFRMMSGEEISPGYGDVLCKKATALGVIVKNADDTYAIVRDTSVNVTLVAETPDKVKATPKPTDSFEERLARVIKQEGAPASPGAKVVSVSDAVRASFEMGILTFGTWWNGMQAMKAALPDKYWDELACLTISRKLKTDAGRAESYVAFKPEFKAAEWDSLAWEALKKMPAEVFVSLFRRVDDLPAQFKCEECKESFRVPRRCVACNKAKKESFSNRISL